MRARSHATRDRSPVAYLALRPAIRGAPGANAAPRPVIGLVRLATTGPAERLAWRTRSLGMIGEVLLHRLDEVQDVLTEDRVRLRVHERGAAVESADGGSVLVDYLEVDAALQGA